MAIRANVQGFSSWTSDAAMLQAALDAAYTVSDLLRDHLEFTVLEEITANATRMAYPVFGQKHIVCYPGIPVGEPCVWILMERSDGVIAVVAAENGSYQRNSCGVRFWTDSTGVTEITPTILNVGWGNGNPCVYFSQYDLGGPSWNAAGYIEWDEGTHVATLTTYCEFGGHYVPGTTRGTIVLPDYWPTPPNPEGSGPLGTENGISVWRGLSTRRRRYVLSQNGDY